MSLGGISCGLDLSLTGAGVAIAHSPDAAEWGDEERFQVHQFGRAGKNDETLDQRLDRIDTMVEQIGSVICNLMQWPQVAIVEQPAYGQTNGKSHDRSGLWWLVVRRVARTYAIPTLEVTPQKVKIYATGNGAASKDEVIAAVVRRYPDAPVTTNNEADAFVLAAIGLRLLGEPIEESLPKTHLRAMEGLTIP
ncbi:RuvC-like resolvase [Microbacterium phage Fizzles]|nr:RuvC-like resolvase [Microbacterium phage Fizzles]